MEKLNYSLHAEVLMNREVDATKDHISPGGFSMKMAGREVTFDFHLMSTSISNENKKLIDIICEDPMFEYEDSADITKEMLERVSEVSDFFIFTGEADETDLVPVKLVNAYFYLPDEGVSIGIPKDVIKKASLGCAA